MEPWTNSTVLALCLVHRITDSHVKQAVITAHQNMTRLQNWQLEFFDIIGLYSITVSDLVETLLLFL